MAGKKGRSGRPGKPTVLHVLDGTYRKDRHKTRLDAPAVSSGDGRLPPPPASLDPHALEAWMELAETLTHRVFSREDQRAFQTFATMWAGWKKVSAHVLEHGVSETTETKDGRMISAVSSEARVWMDLNGKLLSWFSRYGMTPADRARIHEPPSNPNGKKEENPDDEFGPASA